MDRVRAAYCGVKVLHAREDAEVPLAGRLVAGLRLRDAVVVIVHERLVAGLEHDLAGDVDDPQPDEAHEHEQAPRVAERHDHGEGVEALCVRDVDHEGDDAHDAADGVEAQVAVDAAAELLAEGELPGGGVPLEDRIDDPAQRERRPVDPVPQEGELCLGDVEERLLAGPGVTRNAFSVRCLYASGL